jgi:hypothetical protein
MGLLDLSPVCAEYVSAYDRTTGDPAALLGGLLFLVPLYGCAALLIRETARRARLGWPGIGLLAGGFGLTEAGLVDQSLFISSYRDISSWDDTGTPTLVGPLGVGGYDLIIFLYGHVVCIAAPIAVVEAFRPARRDQPWVGAPSLMGAGVLYLAVSALILVDHLQHESTHASAGQLVSSVLAVIALLAVAFTVGRRPGRPRTQAGVPRPSVVFGATFIAGSGVMFLPPTWIGVAVMVTVILGGIMAIARSARSSRWGPAHDLAVAAAALLANALLAFFTTPLLGDVPTGAKYGHYAAFLIILVVVVALAARSVKERLVTTSLASSSSAGEDR